jgi:O-palmitoleoyl-L-serine hydrolase
MFGLLLLPALVLASNLTLKLVTHDQKAVCIDGSPPGYYYRTNPLSDNFLIVLLGGGWCHTPAECYERSQTLYGSSTFWPPVLDHGLGLTSADVTTNPTFADWNVAVFIYCDGSSYSGNLEQPYSFNGTTLFSRGQRIFEAVIGDLERTFGADQANQVVLYGESAGGIGCLSHVDMLAERWSAVDVRGLCDSSFFIPVQAFSPANTTVVIPTMSNVYRFFNVTAGLDQSCVRALGDFRCLIAEFIFPFLSTPTFMLQSQVDCDQFQNVGLQCLPSPDNLPAPTPACNAQELAYIVAFQKQMRQHASAAGLLQTNGAVQHGLFFDSCIHHSIALFGGYWNNAAYTIQGVTAAQAVKKWLAGASALFVDIPLWPAANARCVAAFQSCLGDLKLPPWQCGPLPWQSHDC